MEIRDSHSLILRPALADQHDGQWICVANNSIAEEKVMIRVQVVSPIEVNIEPRQAEVDANRPATLNCSSRGGPPVRPPIWFHNGKPMIDILREHVHGQRIRLVEPHILHIASVHREDIGRCHKHLCNITGSILTVFLLYSNRNLSMLCSIGT